jgi:LCP family protein required for cell wall assembly
MTISVIPGKKRKFYKRWWFWLMLVVAIFAIGAVAFSYKTGAILNKISGKDGSILDSLRGVVSNEGIVVEDGRTNVLLLGMRGAGVTGGGLLADTIMVASLKKDENKVALISIPRDLYVKVPGESYHSKINSVYALGEQRETGGGMKYMKQIINEVTGQPIHYAATINFAGFEQLVDAVGGINIELLESFSEPLQFHQEHVCDASVFTVRSGKTQKKIDYRGKVVAEYPLCYNHDEECGGAFFLPKGSNHLDGEKALCYVRSRMTSNDYERAKRQQVILSLLKNKLVSMGTLTSFSKLNEILNTLGRNVESDMSAGEMKKFYSRYSKMDNPEILQRVFENSPEGLLTVPQNAPAAAGFILTPRAGWDNYTQIHEVSNNIFELAPQSNIKPVKQYQRPAPTTSESKQ